MKSKKDTKVLQWCQTLVYLALKITGCVSVSKFTSLVNISVSITSSAIRLNIRTIAGWS